MNKLTNKLLVTSRSKIKLAMIRNSITEAIKCYRNYKTYEYINNVKMYNQYIYIIYKYIIQIKLKHKFILGLKTPKKERTMTCN